MKFLCVPCDTPMKLDQVTEPDRGSVSLVYACPTCGYEVAMLTNPQETQMVSSLGVKIGGEGAGLSTSGSKCPFTGMVRDMADGAVATGADGAALPWTAAAEARMAALPEFVQPMVRMGIERFARENGHTSIDEHVLEQARASLGMA